LFWGNDGFLKNYQTNFLDHDPIFFLIIDKNVFWCEISTLIKFAVAFEIQKRLCNLHVGETRQVNPAMIM